MNIFAKITNYFIHNKPLTLMLLIGTLVLGLSSFLFTPKQYNPTVTLPAFQIIVDYPGASADDVEKYITLELQQKISDIQGVDKIYAMSFDGGRSIVNVQFEVGQDIELSETKLRSKIYSDIEQIKLLNLSPVIKNINPEDVPIVTIGFYSNNYNQNDLRQEVIDIMNKLKRTSGVANLKVHGGDTKSINVYLDNNKLNEYNISSAQVEQVIQSNNLYFTNFVKRDGTNYSQISLDASVSDIEQLNYLKVSNGILLKDIATIEYGFTQKSSYVYVADLTDAQQEYVFLSVAKVKGENTSNVADNIIKELDKIISTKEYKNISYEIFNNDGEVATNEISNLVVNLIQSISIVFIILLIFLNKKPAILVSFAIPLTLLLVFTFAYLTGQNINRITMFSLILALGLLVDSATVIVENIYRHINKNTKSDKTKEKIIVNGVNEVGLGLFMSTLTSVIVFLPTSRLSGLMGEYMLPISMFVPIALIMSFVVAIIFTPYLSFYFIKPIKKSNKVDFIQKITNLYKKLLVKLLSSRKNQYRFLLSVVIALIVVLSFPIFRFVHFKMLPTADRNQFYVYIDAKEGTDIVATKKITDEINGIILQNEYVENIETFVGEPAVIDFNGLFKGADNRIGYNLATLKVNLIDTNNRNVISEKIVQDTRHNIQSSNLDFTQFDYTVIEDPPGPPVMATVRAAVKSDNLDDQVYVTKYLTELFKNTNGVVHTNNTIEDGIYRKQIVIDHKKAANLNVTTASLYSVLNNFYNVNKVSQLKNYDSNELSFIEISTKNTISDNNILSNIFVLNNLNNKIPLSEIAYIKETRHSSVLFLDNKEPTLYVNAETNKVSIVYVIIDLFNKILINDLNGYKVDNFNLYTIDLRNLETNNIVKIEWRGEWEMTLDSFRDLGIAMMISFALVFAVLTAQFNSFKNSAIIMSTIPLGFIGILPGFALLDLINGTFLTATSLIGFIALMGIVVNNAIIYFEYFTQVLDTKIRLKDALIEAGSTRLRPILLTSLTTILGSLTIAHDPVWSGLAWAIVFGLSVSTTITLFLFPVIINLTYKDK